jgi:hypothetical protein
MTHINESYAKAPNSYQVSGPVIDISFGLMDIDGDDVSGPTVHQKVLSGIDGASLIEHKIDITDLRFR